MTRKQKLPLGIQSFSRLRQGGYTYIDKTKHIYELITTGESYFLSRPRRFGKSLLIRTIQEIFKGNKDLFKDLYIYQTDYDWKKYPVLTLSLSTMDCSSANALMKDLEWSLLEIARSYNIAIEEAPSLKTKFSTLVSRLSSTSEGVVILIDEYDYPIMQNVGREDIAEECREVLHNFFVILKDLSDHLRFLLISGVTTFSKASVFSGLNNLDDISLAPKTSTLLGYTEKEIDKYFGSQISEMAKKEVMPPSQLLDKIREWYNGYLFTENISSENKVYNPFSVLSFISHGRLLNYWAETGTPFFLAHLIRKQGFSITSIENSEVNIDETKSFELKKFNLLPLLWQTGYLTIESYNQTTQNYTLRYPNKEVKISFFTYFMGYLTNENLAQLKNYLIKLAQALTQNNLPVFFQCLKIFFATVPYSMQLPVEKYYQSIFYIILTIIGTEIQGEVHTNNGRIDAVVENESTIYIFEFKLDSPPNTALQQIEQKEYYQKYLLADKKIILVGVSFNSEKKNIDEWLSKELS